LVSILKHDSNPANINIAGLAGQHQYTNASLAIGLVRDFLQTATLPSSFDESKAVLPQLHELLQGAETEVPGPVRSGLESTSWPGRCQTAPDPSHSNLVWYLDGAHTVDSLTCCADWFAKADQSIETSR